MLLILRQLLYCLCLTILVSTASALEFSDAERALIEQYGPWPPELPRDSSNAVSGNEAAIRLGEMLFFDHGLGNDSKFSCASCHDPGRGFTDGRATGQGRRTLARNTSSLLNLKASRWYGWGGEHDSLWAQSIRPILALDEMAATPQLVREVLLSRERYQQLYREAFGAAVQSHDNELLLVNAGKALAAYQETLVSPRSAFDDFRDALLENDPAGIEAYPESAQRGLKLFIGEGRCNLCHLGPRFTSGEFADVGVSLLSVNGTDTGRFHGIERLRANPYNLLGKYNDGDAQHNAVSTRQVKSTPRNRGEFRIPGLRGVAVTAPYMHNGSLGSLRDVVMHYSELDVERLPAVDQGLLRPLKLNASEVDDLVHFLESLGSE
jgi:cytochrome c peroxidase